MILSDFEMGLLVRKRYDDVAFIAKCSVSGNGLSGDLRRRAFTGRRWAFALV